MIILAFLFLLRRELPENTRKMPVLPDSTDSVVESDRQKVDSVPNKLPKRNSAIPRIDSGLAIPQKGPTEDTIPPYVYADPAGGLFGDSAAIRLVTDEPCSVYYKTKEMPGWSIFEELIVLRRSDELAFYAMDSAGNISKEKWEGYDIEPAGAAHCPGNMAYVSSPEGEFCIDLYEWPNRKSAMPRNMISHYAARESCASVGKNLCAAQQWHLACIGKRTARFSYGNSYEPRACNTNTAACSPAGQFVECRSYYGPMDMNGNLREWTATRSNENPRFYEVRGGSWESHSQSGCEETQYSFYPQNQHLSVGFRCCQQAEHPEPGTNN